MKTESKIVKAARVASGITQEQAAKVIDVSAPTYIAREKVPKAFTIDELERLHDAFNQDGRKIIESYVREIFFA